MRVDRLVISMVFMMKWLRSMEMLMYGSSVVIYLIIYQYLLSLMNRYSVFMVDYHQISKR